MKKLNEILGTKYPFIQGGMANIATGEFAAACSNAGALGMIATGGWDGDRLRQEIRRAKELTDKPFGVNLMLMSPYADDIAQIILEEGVKVVTTGAGNPGKYMQAVLKAKDSDTVVTGRSIGGPVRILKNKMAREYLALEKRGASLEELEKVTLGGLRRAVLEGDVEMGSVMSGQVAGMLHEIRPVAEIFRDLYESGIARAKATAAEWSDAE